VTAGPRDERSAGTAGRRQLRASHSDREQVIELLKAAFVQDRLTKDELDTRVGLALAARTDAELTALTADIPVGPVAAPPTRAPAPARRRPSARARRRRPLVRAAAGSGACLAFAFALVLFAANVLDPHGLGNPYHPWSRLCLFVAIASLCAALFIAMNGVATSVEQRRSRRQLPPRPGPGGRALSSGQRGATDRGPVPPDPHPDQTRADLRTHQPGRDQRHHPSGPGPRALHRIRPVPGAA